MNNENRYYPYSEYLKNKYGEKVYKLPIHLPITCPNRKNGVGCTFCADIGTGFEAASSLVPIKEQMKITKEHIASKYHAKKFIAYFQNYTNTYMPKEDFERYIGEAITQEDIVEISLSTRPDCIRKDYMEILKKFHDKYSVNIHIELGLQTANYHVLDQINRGHGLAEYINAVLTIKSYGFSVCTHIILNLPHDTDRDMIETAKIISALGTDIVKIHSLYIAKNSPMDKDYQSGNIKICSKEEYLNRLRLFLEYLDPKIAVERLFSRIPETDSSFSNWSTSWWKLRDEFMEHMAIQQSFQGKKFNYLDGSALDFYETKDEH